MKTRILSLATALLSLFFVSTLVQAQSKKTFANYLLSDAVGMIAKDTNLKLPSAINFANIILMIEEGKLKGQSAEKFLQELKEEGYL